LISRARDFLRDVFFARRTSPPKEPGVFLSLGSTTAGIPVRSEEDALSFSAVWACIRVISETIACLPWHVMERSVSGERRQRDDHLNTWLLNQRPNLEQTAFVWRETIVAHALLWGDGYAEIERDAAGRPTALWILEPHRVSIDRSAGGAIIYRVRNIGREDTQLDQGDIYHIHGLGPVGLQGYYVVALFRQAIGLGLATEQQAASFFGNQALPAGFLKHPGKISTEQAAELLRLFDLRHMGPRSRGRTGILSGGLEYKSEATTNEDAQLEKTRTFQVLEACRIFRVPAHKVSELSRATFSNISEQETAFGRDTILPWKCRLEQEANFKLFPPNAQGRFYTRLNINGLMAGSPVQRADFYGKMQGLGALSVNDILELEDRNGIGSAGDARLVPGNMITLERAVEGPKPPPTPAPADQEDQDPGDTSGRVPGDEETNQRQRKAWLGPIRDTIDWMLRRDRREVARAWRRAGLNLRGEGSAQAFLNWSDGYFSDARALAIERLMPLAIGYCESLNREMNLELIRKVVAAFTSEHYTLETEELVGTDMPKVLERWNSARARAQAERLLNLLEGF